MTMLIPLSKGKFATVDDADFDWLSQFKWSVCTNRYARRRAPRGNGKYLMMHRVILNAPDDMEVDHINGNGFDNTRANLRICTRAQNAQNQRSAHGSSSKYRGVYWSTLQCKWMAQIRPTGSTVKALGSFYLEDAAALAYNQAAILHFGEFARLNVIDEAQS